MKWNLILLAGLISAFCLMCAPAQNSQSNPSLTIYNQEFAVVRERLSIPIKKGTQEISVNEITAHMEPDSVILRDSSGKVDIQILEQNYRNDPISQNLLLQHFEGKEIDFLITTQDGEPRRVRGKIIRAPYVAHQAAMQRYNRSYSMIQSARAHGGGNTPIIEVEGELRFSLPGQPLFPALADDSILKPAISWKLNSSREANDPLQLSYVSGGFTWEADYNLLLPEKGNDVTLIGWVTMDNQSGRTFENAAIKLMAGDISKIQQNQNYSAGRSKALFGAIAMEQLKPTVTEKDFDEYHLYTLNRKTTLRDRETKQVEFIRADEVKSTTSYIYNGALIDWNRYRGYDPESIRNDRNFGAQMNKKVWIYREFENTKKNNLGIPLPKGRLRFYRQDTDGSLEFIGENEIDHSPVNEPVRVYTGDAFDLVGERRRTNHDLNNSDDYLTESFEIKLRNRKKEAATIKVVENLYRWPSWKITKHSDTWQKADSQTIEFLVKLEPDEEKVITYTVHYTW
ncbi:MAG: hypothetical protein AAF571_12835 [Verrucomicrobiota bacterium]